MASETGNYRNLFCLLCYYMLKTVVILVLKTGFEDCHWKVWCFILIADFSGKGQPATATPSSSLAQRKRPFHAKMQGQAWLLSLIWVMVRKELFQGLSQVSSGIVIAVTQRLTEITDVFLQVQICFYLKQFPKPCFMWEAQLTHFSSTS